MHPRGNKDLRQLDVPPDFANDVFSLYPLETVVHDDVVDGIIVTFSEE